MDNYVLATQEDVKVDRIVYCGRHFVLSLGSFELGYLAGRVL